MYISPLSILVLGTLTAITVQSQGNAFNRLRSSAFGIAGQNASYDYVVIGGGTADITIASRLAEDQSLSVAVLEAGGFYEVDNGNYSVLPGLSLSSPFLAASEIYPQQPLMDWNLLSVPQSGALERRVRYAQGKTLSGSSALNALAYHRSSTDSYQRWANMTGDESYTFENLLPYFRKSCSFTPPDYTKRKIPNATVKFDATAFINIGGLLHVSYSNWVDPALTWFQRAFIAIGLPISDVGFNTGSIVNHSSWITSTINPTNGERSSSESSFLKQAISNSGITVYTQAQAQKIQINSKLATGVSVITQGVEYTIQANREGILSAGVFHSPQLLMLSGIGPRTTLEKYSIPVISDLPGVGQNLWDQPIFGVSRQIDLPTQAQLLKSPQSEAEAVSEYLKDASGPYSSLNGLFAFEKIPQILRQNFTRSALGALDQYPMGWPEVEYATATSLGTSGANVGLIEAALSAPISRGNVTISSSSVSSPPVIDLGWYTDAEDADIQVAVAAFKRIRQAFSTISNATIGPELVPGPMVQSDGDILNYIRNVTIPLYHGGATCAMGKTGDSEAVVDSQAKVFGVKGLRVVDMSATPFTPPGHPQATVYMLAEKIADDILKGLSPGVTQSRV